MPVTWGILGTSRIAHERMAPALKQATGCELRAIASRNPEKAKRFASSQGIPKAYGSYEALLADAEIDAVYLPLPNRLHAEYTIAAAKSGKHVLCEKPLATSVVEVEQMFDACTRNGVLLMEGLMYRFHPQLTRVRSVVEEGVIGVPRLIRAALSFPLASEGELDDFRWNARLGGGSLFDLGIYCIDTARQYFPDVPVRVWARSAFPPDRSAEAETQGIVEFRGGQVLMFDTSFLLSHRSEYEVIGGRGMVRASLSYNPGARCDVSITIRAGGQERVENVHGTDEFRLEAEHFVDCICSGVSPDIRREDSLTNVRILEALIRSGETGTWVEL